MLIGGDKTGNDRWYDENVPVADRLDDAFSGSVALIFPVTSFIRYDGWFSGFGTTCCDRIWEILLNVTGAPIRDDYQGIAKNRIIYSIDRKCVFQ